MEDGLGLGIILYSGIIKRPQNSELMIDYSLHGDILGLPERIDFGRSFRDAPLGTGQDQLRGHKVRGGGRSNATGATGREGSVIALVLGLAGFDWLAHLV